MNKYFLVLFVGILILTGCSGENKTEEEKTEETTEEKTNPNIIELHTDQQRQMDIKVEPAKESMLQETIRITGKVEPNQMRTAHIRPLTSGRITKVYVRLGDRVAAGAALLSYDNIEMGDLLAEYQEAFSETELAQKSLERAKKLVDLGSISRAEYEKREAEYKNSIAKQRSIEMRLRRLGVSDISTLASQANISARTILRSPFAGVITQVDAAEGESIGPDQELFAVTDLSEVWVVGNIYEKDLARVQLRQQADVTTGAYSGEVFSGKITYIGDVFDPATRTVKLRCEVPNPAMRLKLEMFVTMEVPVGTQHRGLTIPASAIQKIGEDSLVFVKISDTQFEKRVVQLRKTGEGVEVTEALQPGELVVTQGSFQLKSELMKEEISTEED